MLWAAPHEWHQRNRVLMYRRYSISHCCACVLIYAALRRSLQSCCFAHQAIYDTYVNLARDQHSMHDLLRVSLPRLLDVSSTTFSIRLQTAPGCAGPTSRDCVRPPGPPKRRDCWQQPAPAPAPAYLDRRDWRRHGRRRPGRPRCQRQLVACARLGVEAGEGPGGEAAQAAAQRHLSAQQGGRSRGDSAVSEGWALMLGPPAAGRDRSLQYQPS